MTRSGPGSGEAGTGSGKSALLMVAWRAEGPRGTHWTLKQQGFDIPFDASKYAGLTPVHF